MYKITIAYHDGRCETSKTDDPNIYGLMWSLVKCEIKWYKIELT